MFVESFASAVTANARGGSRQRAGLIAGRLRGLERKAKRLGWDSGFIPIEASEMNPPVVKTIRNINEDLSNHPDRDHFPRGV